MDGKFAEINGQSSPSDDLKVWSTCGYSSLSIFCNHGVHLHVHVPYVYPKFLVKDYAHNYVNCPNLKRQNSFTF